MAGNARLEHLAISLDVILPGRAASSTPTSRSQYLDISTLPVASISKVWPGRSLLMPAEHRLGARQITKCQIFRQHSDIELGSNCRVRQDRFDLRSEQECFSVISIIERFDSESVACRKKGSVSAIPNGECKHAAQIFNAIAPVLFI